MRRIAALLALATLIVACDSGTGPPPEPVTFTATITGSLPIGAVLMAFDGSAGEITVHGGWAVVSEDDGRTWVAAIVASPTTTLDVDLTVQNGAAPSIEILQAAGALNQLYPDPSAFAVDVAERVDE